jgi:hypothetical protein
MSEPRVIVALATEAEDDFIWHKLEDIVQTNMYAAGPISIKFAYFGKEGALAIRPFMSTRWATDPDDMRTLLDHARAGCVCGCYTDMDSILGEAVKETKEAPLQAVVIFADNFHGNRDDAFAYAKQLHAAGTRLFVFQQSSRRSAYRNDFKTLAEMTGGAFFEFNPAVERIAERLPRLLEAVTHYAIGGTDALEALANQSAGLLLEQINRTPGGGANK